MESIKRHLLRQFQLPESKIEKLLPNFVATLEAHLSDLDRTLKAGDPAALGSSAHKIKGAFLNLGLNDCAQLAQELETCGKNGNHEADFAAMVAQIHHSFNRHLGEGDLH